MLPFLEGILSYAGDTLGIANTNANDAAQSPSRELPANPFKRTPSAAPPLVIDLSSPSGTPKLPKVRKKASVSDDEKRLVGDYSVPADAVAIPAPHSWFVKETETPRPATTRPTMARKPGANNSFRPINTISDVNTGAGGHRSVTYAKQHRTQKPIGQAQHRGQLAYLEHLSTTPVKASRTSSPHKDNYGRSGTASPFKRRKIGPVIDLADEGDVQEASRSSSPPTPTIQSHHRDSSVKSSQTRTSAESGTTMAGSKQSFQSQSEFRATVDLTDPRRKKVRTLRLERRPEGSRPSRFRGGVVSSSVKAPSRSPSAVLLDEDHASTRQQLLKDFQQGVSARPTKHRTQSSRSPGAVTSRHFQNARINESTLEVHGQTATSSRHFASNDMNLRSTHVPVPRKSAEMDDSADELAMPEPADHSRRQKPSKALQAANSGAKRRDLMKSSGKGWLLKFARTHEFERTGPDLWLKPDACDTREYQFSCKDADHNSARLKPSMFLSRLVALEADDISCVRLKGGRKSDGNMYTFDLEFANPEEFREFRDQIVVPGTGMLKYIRKEESWMRKIFDADLPRNHKVGNSPRAIEPNHAAEMWDSQADVQTKPDKTPLLTNLLTKPLTDKGAAVAAVTALPQPTRSRPSRSTKTPKSVYEVEERSERRTVEKYSETVGLGTRWAKPLEYGTVRQRAIVHFDDLARLDEEEFMNDSLIDFYMIYLFNKSNVPSDKVYFFNTYFFTALTKNTGRQSSMNYTAVERWTQKIDIFGYDYIVVPINEATHWYLAIICNVSKIDRKPVIEDFDEDLAGVLSGSSEAKVAEARIDVHDISDAVLPVSSVASPKATPAELSERDNGNDEDVNLFEEESEINLIDPHATETEGESQSQVKYSDSEGALHSPAVRTTNMARASLEPKIERHGILSHKPTSPEKKKKNKRKHMPPKRDPDEPIILILDSLSQTRSATVRALKDWLAAEGKAKRGMEATIKEKGYYPKASQIPMQNNWTDCGVYLLGYVDKFFRNPDEFKDKLLLGEMSSDEDWPELKPKEMRNTMRETIFQCAREQEITRKEEKKVKRGSAKIIAKPVATAPAMGPTIHEKNTNVEPNAPQPDNGQVQSEEISDAQASQEAPRPRLASPFEFTPLSAGPSDLIQSVEAGRGAPGSLSVTASPTKPASGTSPRHRSPEVRILSRTPQSHTSTRDGQSDSNKPARQADTRRSHDDTQTSLPTVTRQSAKSPRQPEFRRAARSSPITKSNREGSAPNLPIEIPDSQDAKPTASTHRKHLRRDDVDEGASADRELMAKLNAASRDDGSVDGEVEDVFDPMDLDPPEGDAMDIDRSSRGSEVNETPEPDHGASIPQQWTDKRKRRFSTVRGV